MICQVIRWYTVHDCIYVGSAPADEWRLKALEVELSQLKSPSSSSVDSGGVVTAAAGTSKPTAPVVVGKLHTDSHTQRQCITRDR